MALSSAMQAGGGGLGASFGGPPRVPVDILPAMGHPASRRSKQSVCDAFLAKLSDRGDIDVTQAFTEGILQHFDKLPTR